MDILIPALLIVAGFLLIMVEVYVIPGFNVVGILGFLLIIFAIGWVYIEQGAVGGSIALGASAATGGFVLWVLWRSKAWQRFILDAKIVRDKSVEETEEELRQRYLNQSGLALTPLRPIGTAEIDGERIEVTTEGEFVAAGSVVRVVAMTRRTYVVRLVGEEA